MYFAHTISLLTASLLQHQHDSVPLLAQQLLLALAPLHAQLLPRPETAFLCPSSFNAAVGKALMSELASRPVLDMFQHGQAQLSMWHVWWHIGLRKYAASRQQQQQQPSNPAAAAAGLDALYLDPDAK
jgi:hypothetical protein